MGGMLNGAVARIILRWLASALVVYGLVGPDEGRWIAVDPDMAWIVEVGVGLAIGTATEWWYVLAKRWGWAT